MSEPFLKRLAGIFLGLSVIAVMAVLVCAVVFLAYHFKQYQQQVAALGTENPPVIVAITDPAPGTETLAGVPLLVRVDVNSAFSLSAIELWANGGVVGAARQLANASPLAAALIPWTPALAGDYALIGRAISQDGEIVDSAPLFLRVLPSAMLGELPVEEGPVLLVGGGGEGAAPAELPLAVLPPWSPAAPGPGDLVAPADDWQVTPGDWLNGLGAVNPPTAPEISVEVQGCEITLFIQDKSANEDGFFVYRHTPSMPQWSLHNTLDGQSQTEFITFTETGLPGMLSYKVAAFNAQGESTSNPVSVSLATPDCPPPANNPPVIAVSFVDLISDQMADKIYCYTSLGGQGWERWPLTGFFAPTDGSAESSEAEIVKLVMDELGNTPLTLYLDCWGWAGEALLHLGNFELPNLGDDPGGYSSIDPTTAGQLILTLGKGAAMDYISEKKFAELVSLRLLTPQGWSTAHEETCLKYADFPSTCQGTDWDYIYDPTYVLLHYEDKQNCALGHDCIDPTDSQSISEFPGEYGFKIHYVTGPTVLVSKINKNVTVYKPPPAGCGAQNYNLFVSTYYIPEGSNIMIESPATHIAAPVPCASVDYTMLEITLKSVKFEDVFEEPEEGETIELYGGFLSMVLGSPQYKQLEMGNKGDYVGNNCPMPDGVPFDQTGNWGGQCPVKAYPFNEYALSSQYFCEAGLGGCTGPLKYGNNHMVIGVSEGQLILLSASFFDVDLLSATDTACSATTQVLKTPAEWAEGSQTFYLANDFNGTAKCRMEFEVTPYFYFDAP